GFPKEAVMGSPWGRYALGLFLVVLVGCSPITVRTVHSPDLFEGWRSSVGMDSTPGQRTAQTLRQFDLLEPYQTDPENALRLLHDEAVKAPNPDLLFALADLHYQRGTLDERWGHRSALTHYYLTAGYAWHYLFATCDSSRQDALAPRDAFDPRFRLACDLYN